MSLDKCDGCMVDPIGKMGYNKNESCEYFTNYLVKGYVSAGETEIWVIRCESHNKLFFQRGGTIMANSNIHTEEFEQLQSDGAKALIMNIVFFVVLFAGILLVPVIGFGFSAIAIGLTFIISMLYIYLT